MTILDRFRIDDRVAIVTGASSGLGVSFAVALKILFTPQPLDQSELRTPATPAESRRAYTMPLTCCGVALAGARARNRLVKSC